MAKNTAKALTAMGAAAAAATAGYYFYASKHAKKNRQVVAKWANTMKDEVMEKARDLQDMDRTALWSVIDGVAESYGKLRSFDAKDIARAVGELKENWQRVRDDVKKRIGKKGVGKAVRSRVASFSRAAKKSGGKRTRKAASSR